MSIGLTTPLLTTDTASLASNSTQKDSRLHKAAQQFESLLISEMLKSAHGSDDDGWLGSGDSAGSNSAMQMAESQLAEALSSGKGLGLASIIEQKMGRQIANGPAAQNVAEIPPANAGVSLKKP